VCVCVSNFFILPSTLFPPFFFAPWYFFPFYTGPSSRVVTHTRVARRLKTFWSMSWPFSHWLYTNRFVSSRDIVAAQLVDLIAVWQRVENNNIA
jgi:hypothetical protein